MRTTSILDARAQRWHRALFLAIWGAGVIAIIMQLHALYQPEVRGGNWIARLTHEKGNVRYRADMDISWLGANAQQLLYTGDSIATGKESSAEISLLTGWVIQLQSDTQIVISLPEDNPSAMPMINLLRGDIRISDLNGQPSANGIRVQAGKREFLLADPSSEISLSRARGSAESQVVRVEGRVQEVAGNVATIWSGSSATATTGTNPSVETALAKLVTADALQPAAAPNAMRLNITEKVDIKRTSLDDLPGMTHTAPAVPVAKLPERKHKASPWQQIQRAKQEAATFGSVRGFEPIITSPKPGVHLWTLLPVSDAAFMEPLRVEIQPPESEVTFVDHWQPAVTLQADTTSSSVSEYVIGPVGLDTHTLSLHVESAIKEADIRTSESGLPMRTLYARSGARNTGSEGQPQFSLSEDAIAFNITTLAEWPSTPVRLSLGRVDPRPVGQGWVAQRVPIDPQQTPQSLIITKGASHAGILGLMAGAEYFQLAPDSTELQDAGVYIAQKGQILALIPDTSNWTTSDMRKVRKALAGDVVFAGAPAVYLHELQAGNIGKATAENRGDKMLVMTQDQSVEVSKDFIESNAAVAEFVDSVAEIVISNELKILDYDAPQKGSK